MAKKKLDETSDPTELKKHDPLTAKDVLDEARAGDKVALEILEEVCEILGSALSDIACVVNPEVIVIGGGVSKAGSILIDCIQKHFVARAFHSCCGTKFVAAGLGNDAGIYGCAELVIG
jgi:glucokinase